MRLINTRSFKIEEFGTGTLPPYAILSHTWGDEEVSFQDMADLSTAQKKAGFAKIEMCCHQGVRDGLDWAWVDTCCIDKTSSTELSETINSMFRYYEQSMKCYAVLSDISSRSQTGHGPQTAPSDEDLSHQHSAITPMQLAQFTIFSSRWWTRGWTLQELIAPYDVEFYSREWHYLTSKQACKRYINRKYGISLGILDHSAPLASICVAERMSWASCRYTTREEDMAYCLLGIFGVNMPLLYGEGPKSFSRLQEQIISTTEDYTLFLWGLWTPDSLVHLHSDVEDSSTSERARASIFQNPLGSILATSPRDFSNNQSWSPWTDIRPNMPIFGEPTQLTSRGLRLTLFVREITTGDLEGQPETELSRSLNAFFRCLAEDGFDDFVVRVRPMRRSLARSLYLGAFQSYSKMTGACQPCVLLLSLTPPLLSAPDDDKTETKILVFARLMWFSTMVKYSEIRNGAEEWALKTCYIKTTTDPELLRRGLTLGHQLRPWISYKFWTWRTHSRTFQQLAFNVSTTESETRRCLHIKPEGEFPGCLISVAARKGRYWMSHQIGDQFDVEAEADRFKSIDLDQFWIKTAKEVGPIGVDRVDFESGSLFATLVIGRLGVFDNYRVSLAMVEKSNTSELGQN